MDMVSNAPIISQAIRIAQRDLSACYCENGILAGTHHFTDYWARDGFFASFGSLSIGDDTIVKKQLDLFLSHQRQDGLIPYRVMRGPITLSKYVGKPKLFHTPKPTYRLRGVGQEIFDGTTLTMLVLAQYAKVHLIPSSQYIVQINKGLAYLHNKERSGLLWDGVMAEWNDTAYKYGNLLYTNILYWKMYQELADWTKDSAFALKSNYIAEALYKYLFNGHFFADWSDHIRQDYFYPFGNLLAVIWGLTSPEESRMILEKTEKTRVSFTVDTNSPKYPWWRIDPLHQLIGMGDYQNQSILWWQAGCAYVVALKKFNQLSQANQQLALMAQQIVKYDGVYECYERSGEPVKRLFYRSEKPFAWGAGMFLWAATSSFAS